MKKLLAAGANVNLKRSDSATPLTEACRGTNRGAFALLIEHPGIDVNEKGSGETPLTLSASRGNVDFVEKLVAKGARKDDKNDSGQRPRDLTGDASILALLGPAPA